jgi:hypothetical protein
VQNVYPAEELKGTTCAQAGFQFKEFCGTAPDVSIPKMISLLRKTVNGPSRLQGTWPKV